MEEPDLFIEQITINAVRHLKDVTIPISSTERKHLILTGKNGSGKTSTLLELKEAIKISLFQHEEHKKLADERNSIKQLIQKLEDQEKKSNKRKSKLELAFLGDPIEDAKKELHNVQNRLKELEKISLIIEPVVILFISTLLSKGEFILASFDARRNLELEIPQGIKKFEFKRIYQLDDSISTKFLQHIVNLKADRSFAKDELQKEVVEKIDDWFEVFENSLKKIFEDEKLQLKFKHREYSFDIILRSGQTMPFNALSDGYSAILDIVMELMLRMEGKVKNVYDIQGIVLIDEIETHLHIDLQKKILPFLTSFFPKIQFIVSTHSPFVINSLSNAVVYDLENHTRFEDLSDYPIDGIVEGYFDNDKYSEIAKQKVEEYEKLTEKDLLTEAEKKRRLQLYNELKDVSGKLAPELKFKFQQIQLKRLAKTNG